MKYTSLKFMITPHESVASSLDLRGSTQLTWEVSVRHSKVQLKRRDLLISKLSSTVPEEEKLTLRESTFCKADIFEKPLIRHADVTVQETTQRKATLTMLRSKMTSWTMPLPPPWGTQGQSK